MESKGRGRRGEEGSARNELSRRASAVASYCRRVMMGVYPEMQYFT